MELKFHVCYGGNTHSTLPKLSFFFFLEVEEYVSVAENTNFCSFNNIFSAEIIKFANTFTASVQQNSQSQLMALKT